MNWQDLAGPLIKLGAPTIGTALGGPLGGVIGGAVGNILGSVLGVPPTPEAVDKAIKDTPAAELQDKLAAAEADAQAKYPALAEIAKAEAEAQARSLSETAITMRAEALSGDTVQRWWRPAYAFEMILECAAVWIVAFADLLLGSGKVATFVLSSQELLTTYWMARFGVLGVYVGGRSWEKIIAERTTPAMVDKLAPSVIEQIVKAVRRK